MKKIFAFLLLISRAGITQNISIPDSLTSSSDKMADFISRNYSTPSEKVYVIYNWITNHIAYDIDNLYAINLRENREQLIKKTLLSRKAICQGYAELFNDLCIRCGISSYVIMGFTKQSGFLDYIGHAWNVAYINNSYHIYDATWGSGGISNKRFIKKPNMNFFDKGPISMLKTHYPYDPMWQLLFHPINQGAFFNDMIKEDPATPYFNFPDSIALYSKQDSLTCFSACFKRMEKNGVKNTLTYEYFNYVNREIDYLKNVQETKRKNAVLEKYNTAINNHNLTVNLFNEYIQFKNKQFAPAKPDSTIKNMMADIKYFSALSKAQADSLNQQIDESMQGSLTSLKKMIADLEPRIKEENEFVTKYIKTPKSKRKSLFYVYTYFGQPINNQK